MGILLTDYRKFDLNDILEQLKSRTEPPLKVVVQ